MFIFNVYSDKKETVVLAKSKKEAMSEVENSFHAEVATPASVTGEIIVCNSCKNETTMYRNISAITGLKYEAK